MAFWDKFTTTAVDSVKDQVNTVKDTTNSAVFKTAINPFIRKYGQILAFKIDSRNKAFLFEIELKGETKPIRVEIDKYEFIQKDDKSFVKIHSMHASRYWMDTMMELMLLEKEFELPKELNKPIQTFM